MVQASEFVRPVKTDDRKTAVSQSALSVGTLKAGLGKAKKALGRRGLLLAAPEEASHLFGKRLISLDYICYNLFVAPFVAPVPFRCDGS